MKIEIWSDIVCPWCYIGKRRFESALEEFEEEFDEEVELVYRSFELAPDAPKRVEGSLEETLMAKYGMGQARARQTQAQIEQAAAAEGLEFDLDNVQGGNTLDAHRVLHFALRQGDQVDMKERLMRAYFVEGRAISEPAELAKIAGEAGLDAEAVAEMLASDDLKEDVRADEAQARELGIRGVPYFLIEEVDAVSGAQPSETFLDALQGAQERRAKVRAKACGEGMC